MLNFNPASEHPIIKLWTKRIILNFILKIFKLDLKSDVTLTLGYFNPALDKLAPEANNP